MNGHAHVHHAKTLVDRTCVEIEEEDNILFMDVSDLVKSSILDGKLWPLR